jgi:hypothetical protein
MTQIETHDFVYNFLQNASQNEILRGRFDPSDLVVEFTNDEFGFAEYWPRELHKDHDKDKLIVCLNETSCERLTLTATLIHEIYGHASYYEMLRRNAPMFIDHGALVLIEGWATGCEWALADPAYGRWTRSRRLRSLSIVDSPVDNLIRFVMELAFEENCESQIDDRLAEMFQYPGLAASYAVGGAWFTNYVGVDGMYEFESRMRGKAWGDFMVSWSL